MRPFRTIFCFLCIAGFACCAPFTFAAVRVTILYDAFGDNPQLTRDWGFSALVEHDGKRILFDSGNNPEIFEHNVKALNVDLSKLDFVVISHRHTDHTSGLKYLLKINPDVTVYVPADGANGFGGADLPAAAFFRPETSLPAKMRYFDGAYPEHARAGKLYDAGHFVLVDKLTEVAPGIFLVFTVSKNPHTLEMPELTLAIKGPHGLVLVDGCSHSGIEEILQAASAVDPHIHVVFGGLHLVQTPIPEIDRLADALKNKWKLDQIAPGHCTGEPAFLRLQKTFGESYLFAGLGTQIAVN
jgi:7,8-dihydropterin-6-yl-methyl-4-(beta-D-ribofuranosyl)aminobenzene 5'-phosphate synthase